MSSKSEFRKFMFDLLNPEQLAKDFLINTVQVSIKNELDNLSKIYIIEYTVLFGLIILFDEIVYDIYNYIYCFNGICFIYRLLQMIQDIINDKHIGARIYNKLHVLINRIRVLLVCIILSLVLKNGIILLLMDIGYLIIKYNKNISFIGLIFNDLDLKISFILFLICNMVPYFMIEYYNKYY